MDYTAPIILVGAGRSGTTLLDSALGEHSQIYSIGETSFLFHRLWQTLMEKENYHFQYRHTKLARERHAEGRDMTWVAFSRKFVRGNYANLGTMFDDIVAEESRRLPLELGEAFARLMIPPALRKERWLFREIWMGSQQFPYTWDIYRRAFPNAHYVQLIRHPIEFLRSYFNNMKLQASPEQASAALDEWLTMVRYARTLRDTGRFIEVRYEDLVADNGKTMDRILAFAGLQPEKRCHEMLGFSFLPSSGNNNFEDDATELYRRNPEIADELMRLGYT